MRIKAYDTGPNGKVEGPGTKKVSELGINAPKREEKELKMEEKVPFGCKKEPKGEEKTLFDCHIRTRPPNGGV